MLNLTYLVNPGEEDQQMLARVKYYALLFLLSDETELLARELTAARWIGSADVACWIIQRKHLDVSPPGSVLAKINDALRSSPTAATEDHSFLSWMERKDFVAGRSDASRTIQLELHSCRTADEMSAKIVRAMDEAVKDITKNPVRDKLKFLVPVGIDVVIREVLERLL